MKGRLGALFIGVKQIGGFLDWSVKLNLSEGVDGNDKTVKLQSWIVTAWSHWITRPLEIGTKVRLKLCSDAGPGYWECTGTIASKTTSQLNTLIHVQLEITGMGELEGKGEE